MGRLGYGRGMNPFRRRGHQRLHWVGLALLLGVRPAAADCNDPFADPNAIVDLHLQMSSETWRDLSESREEGADPMSGAGAGCDEQYPYFEAQFRCGDDEQWLAIGVRRKRDRTETQFKLPLKLDFNRTVDGQRWPASKGELGFRRLTLNSGQPDQAAGMGFGGAEGDHPAGVLSALLTEHLAWRVMRQALPEASGSAYARLTLHFSDSNETQLQGLYILIEDIDRTTVRARYGADEGALYKTTDPACIDEVVFEDEPPNSATDAFDTWLGLDPNDFAGSWYERTNEALDLEGLLQQEALREILVNTEDTILGRMNNYFAVDLQGKRRVYLPWDLDDMFRPEPQARPADTPFVSSCVGAGDTCAPIPLGVNIRDNAELRPIYLETMCTLTNGVAHEDRLLEQLQSIDALIRPEIEREVPILWQPANRDPLAADIDGTYAAEFNRMQEFIPARLAAVRRLIEAEGVDCKKGLATATSDSKADADAGCGCRLAGSPTSRPGCSWLALGVVAFGLSRRSRPSAQNSRPAQRATHETR